jgi:nitrous oxidase accessory protein
MNEGARGAVLLLLAAACADGAAATAPSRAAVPRPASCADVPSGALLQPLLDATPAGGALCLAPGVYDGPLVLRGVTLWGPREAVIRSHEGTTISLEGSAHLLGVSVDGSGGRFDLLDAAVHATGEGPVVEGVLIERATFGILVEKSAGARLTGNHVIGDRRLPLGLRGDGIRLWETRDSLVEGNLVEEARDVVVWYSPRNRVVRNTVRRGRYGTHFMYSHDSIAEENDYRGNVVGVFIMYSRGITVRRNLISDHAGAAGIGVGLKDSGEITLEDNLIVHDTVGIYVDTSPVAEGDHNRFSGNLLRLCDTAVIFLSSTARSTFTGNGFVDNDVQVRVDGGGDALGLRWEANFFDDYAGYDLDGDGAGDVPYELRSLTADLAGRSPAMAFFHGTPALEMADAASHLLPLLAPKVVLRDERPRLIAPRWELP